MFCYQCQEAMHGTGCNREKGVCGKTQDVAALQDLLVWSVERLSKTIVDKQLKAEHLGDINSHVVRALFMTITNANFDEDALIKEIRTVNGDRQALLQSGVCHNCSREKVIELGKTVGILAESDENLRSLKAFLTYGLKGLAAYLEHAKRLGYEDFGIYDFLYKTMERVLVSRDKEELLNLLLETGAYGVKAMALLDQANTDTYGRPEVTSVDIGVRNHPGILVSGHDLRDLEELLEASEGTGVDIYTHGEMLPAHYYPFFKKFDHFAGNYGNAWWKQKEEFASFRGPVLFTTNCIVPPRDQEMVSRIFTTGAAGYPGCRHIAETKEGKKDFSEILALAKTLPAPMEIEHGTITGGFAHHQVMALADEIVKNIENGSIKRFIVMAGCDGRQKAREYYTEFAQKLPQDTVILTAGCAKYRYNKLSLGDINGIPRVLDAGQCNDAYSLALIALKLKDIFALQDINDLPIDYNIAWYEQKAVIVLLALLSLGVKNIHLGPTLPAFLSPDVAELLVEKFGLAPIKDVCGDLEHFVGKKEEENGEEN